VPGWAEVDERRGRLFVISWSRMGGGRSSRANGWVRSVDTTTTSADLGALVREALAESRADALMVNFRDPTQSPNTPLLALAGVKSYQGYEYGRRACLIDLDGDEPGFVIRPQRPDRESGQVDLDDAIERMSAAVADTELGEAVRRGVSRSIRWPTGGRAARKDHFRTAP
jgi:hypothetical protein